MIDLTARQIQILRSVIEEFIRTAEPVGSDTIDKKFNIGVSPATIRNEMVHLTKQGYLVKGHSSSGRMPTPLALRLYVNELMKEQELSVADEVSAKEKIWHYRRNIDDLLRETVRVLADRGHAVGLAMTADNHVYCSGHANLLNMPEFYDINVARHVLSLLEENQLLTEIFSHPASGNQVQVVYGQELGNRYLEPVGVIFLTVQAGGQTCQLAVVGSTRFEYKYLIPMMRHIRQVIEELAVT